MSETLHDEESKVGARALQGLGRGEKGRGGQTEMGQHSTGTGRNAATFGGTARDEAARRGTKKARPRGAGRAGGGLGAKFT